ncbi:Cytoplasmic FMR1-interacting protein 1 [Allomyces arbusculus]|nr:Cytoplasmic FMR1-interacting protein 1 [Allomyces arbusculus]
MAASPPSSPTVGSGGANSAQLLDAGIRASTALAHRHLHATAWSSVSSGPSLKVPRLETRLAELALYPIPELAYFRKEVAWIAQLNDILDRSTAFISLVYAYRGCVKAVPGFNPNSPASPTGSNMDEIKAAFYRLVEEVVLPEIQKMKDLMAFYETTANTLGTLLKEVAASLSTQPPTEDLMLALAKTLNMLMVMDSLKNMKTSLNNDFTLIFRRSRTISKNQAGDDKENQMLYLFLANRDVFLTKLKALVPTVPGIDDLLWELAASMCDRLERGHYATPKEKFTIIKAAAFSMVLADPFLVPKLMTQKKWKVDRYLKVFRSNLVVPLYGDLTLEVAAILSRTVNQKWDLAPAPFDLDMADLRRGYADYFARLAQMLDQCRKTQAADVLDSHCREVFDLLAEGIKLVTTLSATVLELNANKYANPTNHTANPDCPETALNYEQAIRYNYQHDERFALVEVLTMIKTAEDRLLKADVELSAFVTKHAVCFLNSFQQMALTNIVQHAARKKKQSHTMLRAVSDLLGQHMSSAQIYMARGLLEWIFKINAVKPGFMKERELKDAHLADLQHLYQQLYWIPVVQALPDVVGAATDLSELWYKEFYLELSKQIQFPIETSLPWILIHQILDSSAVDLTHALFVPFLIYDDAANRALNELKMQYLYDEIEAEANLAFDLFLHKYSHMVFAHFKCKAASLYLGEALKAKMGKAAGIDVPLHQHEHIMRHYKTVKILGRTIPFQQILGQKINLLFRNSLEAIISRFESSSLTAVMELETLLAIVRATHEQLGQHLSLDAFDDMLAEVDEVHVGHGRIVGHLAAELTTDFARHFAYNGITDRFIRSPIQVAERIQRPPVRQHKHEYLYGNKPLNQAFSAQTAPFLLYVGKAHFDAIVRLLGTRVSLLYSDIMATFEELMKDKMTPFLWALTREFPSTLKLPGLDYGVMGTFEYFQFILKPLLSFKDLPTVYQVFRELGNLFLSIKFLEQSMKGGDVLRQYQLPKPAAATSLLQQFGDLFDLPAPPDPLAHDLGQIVAHATALDLVAMFVRTMRPLVHSLAPLWREGIEPASATPTTPTSAPSVIPGALAYDTARDYYRIFSFLHFSYCLGSNYTRGYSCRAVFGDSLHWAGALLLCLTDQVEVFTALDFTAHVCHAASLADGTASIGAANAGSGAAKPATASLAEFTAQGEYFGQVCAAVAAYYKAVVGNDKYWERVAAVAPLRPPAETKAGAARRNTHSHDVGAA